MPLQYGEIQIQESLGSTATTFKYDIDYDYTVNNISTLFFALKDTTVAATNQNLVDKVEQIRVSTKAADPESQIDADDLLQFPNEAFVGVHNTVSKLTSTDNVPHFFGMMYPFSPFPHNMTAPFGLRPNFGKQFIVQTNADTSQDFDNYTMDVIAEGVTGGEAGTQGHIKFTQDSFTSGAVNSFQDTQIIANRLLGVYNFMTTSADDLAASAAHDVTGIREQQLVESSRVQTSWKPFYQWARKRNNALTDLAVIAGDVSDNTANVLDDGRWFHDVGIQSNPVGRNIADRNKKYEIRTIAGVASEATRVYGVLLA